MPQSTLSFSLAGPERVHPREAVLLDLTLANTGDAPVLVNGRFVVDEADGPEGFFEVSLAVTGPGGAPLGFMAEVDAPEAGAGDLVLLAPHATHTGQVRLDRYFMLGDPGDYRVVATYRNALPLERDGRRAFVGALDAAPITVRLVG